MKKPKKVPETGKVPVVSQPRRGYETFGPRLGRKRVDGLGRGWN